MNSDLNLDIDTYSLDDILTLFKLDSNFDEQGLRRARKTVAGTHPDKSGLDKEYFLFFTKAYKILHSVHEFKTRRNSCVSTEYATQDDDGKKALVEDLLTHDDFNRVFNELFEKNKLTQEHQSSGHGEWLKSEEDIDKRTATRANMNQMFDQKKTELRALVPVREVESLEAHGLCDITGEEPEEFGCDVFGSLRYEDVRKAHTETVVPVTEEDRTKNHFRSAEDLRNHRAAQDTTPLSLQQAKQLLGEQKSLQNQNDIQRAFRLAKQDEESRKRNDAWLSSFKHLKNS
tara:strand:+ start:1090 stop:1953 length:864 start_codon:yes stop_codon:yes gene_type:complete